MAYGLYVHLYLRPFSQIRIIKKVRSEVASDKCCMLHAGMAWRSRPTATAAPLRLYSACAAEARRRVTTTRLVHARAARPSQGCQV